MLIDSEIDRSINACFLYRNQQQFCRIGGRSGRSLLVQYLHRGRELWRAAHGTDTLLEQQQYSGVQQREHNQEGAEQERQRIQLEPRDDPRWRHGQYQGIGYRLQYQESREHVW